jgi:lysozyme
MNLDKATELIKSHEGCRLTAYKDQVGVLTIGYGHTGRDVIEGMTITQELADELLEHDIERTYSMLLHYLPLEISQNERPLNAVLSLVFNIGAGAFAKSTMLKLMNESAPYVDIANEFLRWDKAGGEFNHGLYLRREAEKALFLS